MSELTKEWLLKTIAELEEERDAVPGAVNEDAAMSLAAMKRALASLEAEAVAYVMADDLKDSSIISTPAYRDLGEAMERTVGDVVALYTTPPAPVSVPEPIKRNDADGWWMYKGRRVGGGCAEWYNRALDDCRAAMLQSFGNSEQLNSPVIPDGWVACSQRLPETDGNYWGWWSESKRQGPVWFIKSELQAQFQSGEITHWMALPAAPQQEVAQALAKGMERYGDAMQELAKKEVK